MMKWQDLNARILETVPDGTCGDWAVETYTVSEDDSMFTRLRAAATGRPSEYVPAGTFKRLRHGPSIVMSTTRMEYDTSAGFMHTARGHVLINGLGLGMVLRAILDRQIDGRPAVDSVVIVEKHREVIELVGPAFVGDPRVEIVCADAFTWRPPTGAYYDCVWHDIWTNMGSDNLPEMARLHRRYGRRCGWQASWARRECMRYR